MAKSKKPKKNALPQEFIDKINRMKPEALSVETTFEGNAIDTLKEQLKGDSQIKDLSDQVKALNDKVNNHADVVAAQEVLDRALDEQTTKEHEELKEDLKALKKGWQDDIKNRSKEYKFMKKTLQAHIKSGALKRQST